MVKVLHIKFRAPKKHTNSILCFFVLSFLNAGATTFYINDNSTKGDLYTFVIGNDKNNGTSTTTPKLNIQSAYYLAKEGDTIIIDTGNYNDINSSGELLFENTKKIKFIIAGFSDIIYSKNNFPTNEKVSPAIFYIKNDKPIDRDAYLRNLQNEVERK
ncbi:hypothetical protein QWY90_10285 [Flavobacterium paronense]|uniref:DUF1565 domain-containing protein n=1 Tax=Flavobacterium paronense TaxID=1392775 RepID=A0ABV5GBG5_9FLAO|nr:hypothetical protein [Flavobacterium paronense]MDN3677704.1 hypothetical protein [Flavobacterium paronense]